MAILTVGRILWSVVALCYLGPVVDLWELQRRRGYIEPVHVRNVGWAVSGVQLSSVGILNTEGLRTKRAC